MDNTSDTAPGPARPHAMARTVLLYLGLVGIPALGVAAILRAGRSITPPISVGGRWAIEADAAAATALPDLAKGADGSAPALVIVQSGVRLAMTLGPSGLATSTARLDGNRLTAALAKGGTAQLALDGTVTKASGSPRLTGELRRLDCSSCPGVDFSAERVAGPHG